MEHNDLKKQCLGMLCPVPAQRPACLLSESIPLEKSPAAYFLCLSAFPSFRKILVTIPPLRPPFPLSPIRGIYLGNLLKRIAGACIMHEMQSLFLHCTVCILKQDWNCVPARKMNINSSKKKERKKEKVPIYLKERVEKRNPPLFQAVLVGIAQSN